jgi:hypothetical protein
VWELGRVLGFYGVALRIFKRKKETRQIDIILARN